MPGDWGERLHDELVLNQLRSYAGLRCSNNSRGDNLLREACFTATET
jgi:hypothetical protein